MIYKKAIGAAILVCATSFASTLVYGAPVTYEAMNTSAAAATAVETVGLLENTKLLAVDAPLVSAQEVPSDEQTSSSSSTVSHLQTSAPPTVTPELKKKHSLSSTTAKNAVKKSIFTVPFYSQFTDITSAQWKKVGCGIASLAMLIDYYEPNPPSVDTLLGEGIAAHAYLDDAGWTYSGLIGLSKKYGLTGTSHDLSSATMDNAFSSLQTALASGPVMVSIHYKFEPKNPIPHLVIANGIRDGVLYYNDPAAEAGNLSIPVDKFKSAWKKRFIEIRPIS